MEVMSLIRLGVLWSVEFKIPTLVTFLYCYLDVKEAKLVGKTVWP